MVEETGKCVATPFKVAVWNPDRSPEPARATPRLEFANQLRGLAVLFVVASHFLGVFWFLRDQLVPTTLAPAQEGAIPDLVMATRLEWFQPGPFGVGLFFLISGLVMPISLERHTAGSFLAARALRVYPTYVAGLALQLLVLSMASRIWGHVLPYDWKTILANALLIHDLIGRPSTDTVNWTLTIELRFYILVALLSPWLRLGSLAAVVFTAGAMCVLALVLSRTVVNILTPDLSQPAAIVSMQLPFLVLMLTGVVFNLHLRGRLTHAGLVGGVALLAGMTAFAWWFSILRAQFTHVLNNYCYALVLFSALYAGRRHIAANRVLGALAAISYPLYLIHVTLGYFILKVCMILAGMGYWPALLAALAVVGGTSALLHWTIERPSIRWGRRLGSDPGSGGLGNERTEALRATVP